MLNKRYNFSEQQEEWGEREPKGEPELPRALVPRKSQAKDRAQHHRH